MNNLKKIVTLICLSFLLLVLLAVVIVFIFESDKSFVFGTNSTNSFSFGSNSTNLFGFGSNSSKEEKVKVKSTEISDPTVSMELDWLRNMSASNISATELEPIYRLGSEYTELQRELMEKEITNKIVDWELEVYEVISTSNPNKFTIITQTGSESGRSLFRKGNRLNKNVGTKITLVTESKNEIDQVALLMTGDWILVKGKIIGVTLRNINISPAVLIRTIPKESFEN